MTAQEAEPSDARSAFDEAGGTVAGATASQMFGAPCFKIGSKAFCCPLRALRNFAARNRRYGG